MKFIEIQIVETASHRIERTINITAQTFIKSIDDTQEIWKEARMGKLIEDLQQIELLFFNTC